jgi:hypothetical protein
VKARGMLRLGSENRWLGVFLAVSVLVRLGAAIYLGDVVEALPGTHDQLSYDALAQNVAVGRGFVFDQDWYPFTKASTPTAHWSFLYVSYLAAFYAVVGHHPLVPRLVQAVAVGLLTPWLVYRLGRRTLGEAVGLAGAAGVAGYAYLVYYAATLMTEPFYICALLWALDVLQRISYAAQERGSGANGPGRERLKWQWGCWLELGLAWGIATLLRQQVLLLLPVLLAWLMWATWRRVPIRQFCLSAAVSLTVVAAFILPWTVRNYVAYRAFLPLNSNVGWALYAANHPEQGSRFEPLNLPPVPEEWRGLNEAELNSRLTAAGLQFVLDDPGRFALQTLDRFRNYFRFWPERSSPLVSNVSRVLSYGLYLPFMLYGLCLSIGFVRDRRKAVGKRQSVILLYLFVSAYSIIHLLSWAMHRYRLPVDAAMMVFVGVAWVDLGRRFLRWRSAKPSPAETPLP